MPNDGLPDVLVLTVVAFIILLVGVSILSTVAGITINSASTENGKTVQTAGVFDKSQSWDKLGSKTGIDETVYNSRGYAVNLSGASDSYVRSDADVDIGSSNNWTVATWAYADRDATASNMTALSVNGRVAIRYNQSATEWVIWYFDDGTGNSHELTLNAPDQPGNFTHLSVVQNGTHVKAYRNNSQSTSQNVSQSNVVEAPVNTSNWNGRLEETRAFDENLSSSERQSLIDGPIAARPGYNRTARMMYDEPYTSEGIILFSGANLAKSNVSYSTGFDGSEVSESGYDWDANGPRIRRDSGTDYPVLYVDYTVRELGPAAILGPMGAAIVLAGLIPVLLILGYVVTDLSALGGR